MRLELEVGGDMENLRVVVVVVEEEMEEETEGMEEEEAAAAVTKIHSLTLVCNRVDKYIPDHHIIAVNFYLSFYFHELLGNFG